MSSSGQNTLARMTHQVPYGPRVIALMCLVYALLGIVGHDPWKGPDVVNLAVAFDMQSVNLLESDVPRLAGEPWLSIPPLYHWIASHLGDALNGWLSWHGGARLTSALFTLTGLFLISLASRGFHGPEASHIAPLLSIGSLGLLLPAHDAQPALAGFVAIAGVLGSLAWWEIRPVRSAIGMGLAVGIGFLGAGLQSLILTLSVIVIALCFSDWRKVSRKSWLIAFAIMSVLVVSWPALLYQASPSALDRWLQSDIQRVAGDSIWDIKRIELLLWATWPVLPFAAWAVWLHRKQTFLGRHALPLTAAVVSLVMFLITEDATDAIPALVASLSIVGSSEAGRLRRGAANALDWFGAITLTLFMGLIWLAGISILTGTPARIAKNFVKPSFGFQPEVSWLAISTAIAATLCWLYLLFSTPRSPWRASARWGAGTVCIWVLIVCLLLPWINHTKSYRLTAQAIAAQIGDSPDCVERSGLGSSQRASLYYFSGIKTIPANAAMGCRFRIVQAGAGSPSAITGWALTKEFFRAGDRRERLRLYERTR